MGMYFIDLANTHKYNALHAINSQTQEGDFSLFKFGKMPSGVALENQGFYIVHFSSDYQIRIEKH